MIAFLGIFAPSLGNGPVFCGFRVVAGIPCPGCGMTRALGWLARANLEQSMRFHPLAIPTALALFAAWVGGMAHVFRGWTPKPVVSVALMISASTVFVAAWIARLMMFAYEGGIPSEFGAPPRGALIALLASWFARHS